MSEQDEGGDSPLALFATPAELAAADDQRLEQEIRLAASALWDAAGYGKEIIRAYGCALLDEHRRRSIPRLRALGWPV